MMTGGSTEAVLRAVRNVVVARSGTRCLVLQPSDEFVLSPNGTKDRGIFGEKLTAFCSLSRQSRVERRIMDWCLVVKQRTRWSGSEAAHDERYREKPIWDISSIVHREIDTINPTKLKRKGGKKERTPDISQ